MSLWYLLINYMFFLCAQKSTIKTYKPMSCWYTRHGSLPWVSTTKHSQSPRWFCIFRRLKKCGVRPQMQRRGSPVMDGTWRAAVLGAASWSLRICLEVAATMSREFPRQKVDIGYVYGCMIYLLCLEICQSSSFHMMVPKGKIWAHRCRRDRTGSKGSGWFPTGWRSMVNYVWWVINNARW